MAKKIMIASWALLMAFSTAFADQPVPATDQPNGDIHPPISAPAPHQRIEGTVEKVEGEMVFLKLETGVTRQFGVEEAKKEGLNLLEKGDQVVLEVNEANLIVDIHEEGRAIQKEQRHRSVSGTVEQFDPLQNKLTVKTDEGKTETFELKMPVVAKLSGIDQGAKITMEIDEQNRVMDVHKG